VLPAGRVEAVPEHLQEGAVTIDDRNSKCSRGRAHQLGTAPLDGAWPASYSRIGPIRHFFAAG